MAWYVDGDDLTFSAGTADHWKQVYSPGDEVPVSGIYKCINCKKEVTSNKGDPLPSQNHSQHSSSKPIEWKLIVRTNTEGR